jgi:hypothetical protein
MSRVSKPLFVALFLLLALTVTSFAPRATAPGQPENTIPLRAPSFVQVARAQEAGPDAAIAFPQNEAGISAYFKADSPINLADVRRVFRVIEAETTDYLIGSVPVAGYPELYDVHLFIHRDGWFVAYYLSAVLAWLRLANIIVLPGFPCTPASARSVGGARGRSYCVPPPTARRFASCRLNRSIIRTQRTR